MPLKKVLLIDDDEHFVELVSRNLEETGHYEVCKTTRTSKGLFAIFDFNPDIILLDVVVAEIDGFRLAKDIRMNEKIKHIPIVFVTALVDKDEVKEIEKFFGNIPYLIKPVTTGELVAAIEENTQKEAEISEKKKILVVDDDQQFIELVKLNLEDTGKYAVRVEDKGTVAVSAAMIFQPDLILLDVVMGDIDGSQVARQIGETDFGKNIPIVYVTGIINENEQDKLKDFLGGHPFLAKPVTTEALVGAIERYLKNE